MRNEARKQSEKYGFVGDFRVLGRVYRKRAPFGRGYGGQGAKNWKDSGVTILGDPFVGRFDRSAPCRSVGLKPSRPEQTRSFSIGVGRAFKFSNKIALFPPNPIRFLVAFPIPKKCASGSFDFGQESELRKSEMKFFSRPSGTYAFFDQGPTVKTVGYFHDVPTETK